MIRVCFSAFAGLLLLGQIANAQCISRVSIWSVQAWAPHQVEVRTSQGPFILELRSPCYGLQFGQNSIAFESFSPSFLCRGDYVVPVDRFNHRPLDRCVIWDIRR
ncbi:MAG: hypothetical protein ACK5Y2_11730 [Bdellovibrionales bacterium]